MEPLLSAIPAVLLGGYFLARRARRERVETLRAAAEQCAMTDLEESAIFGLPDGLGGRSGPFQVRIEMLRRQRRSGVGIAIEGREELIWLTLRRENVGFALEKKILGTREVEVGDRAFDRDFHLDGTPAVVRAVMDGETRRLLSGLSSALRLEVTDGALRAELGADFGTSGRMLADQVQEVLAMLLDAARRLSYPVDVAARLAENARRDPEEQVRLECLLALVSVYPKEPGTREALIAGCKDSSVEIRLRAASLLGEDGHATLLDVVDYAPDAEAARAITALGNALPLARARETLVRALRMRQIETARACLAALGSFGGADAVRLLTMVMVAESEELTVPAAQALAASGLAEAEPPLVEALGRESEALRLAAAEALGRFASVQAVLPLQQAETRYPRDGALRRAARQAIAEIQSRQRGASPGQLSIAAGESGQLTLAPDDASGQLSLGQTGDAPVGETKGRSLPDKGQGGSD